MPFDVRRLVRLGRVSSLAVSPDGTYAVCAVGRLDATGAKYVSELWRVPLDGGGPGTLLTRGKSNDRAPCFRRDGALGFLSNRAVDDEERDQVWILDGGAEPKPLTDEPLGVSSFKFALRGDVLVVITNVLPGVSHADQRARAKDLEKGGPSDLFYGDRTGPVRHWDHWLGRAKPHVIAYDDRGQNRRDLTPEAQKQYTGDFAYALSSAGAWVAVVERVLSDDRLDDFAIRLIDIQDASSRVIAQGLHVEHGHPLFSREGTRLFFNRSRRSKERHGKVELCVADIASGATSVLCESWDRWPAPQAALSDDAIVATADDEGAVPIFTIDIRSNVTRVTVNGGTHESLCVTQDGRIAGIRHSLSGPPDPFVVDAKKDQTPRMLANLSGFDPKEIESHVTECFDAKGKDGARVQTWIVRPKGDAPAPTVLWIHGGPVGMFGDGWHWRWNPHVLVAQGYAIALPNARGSTGFGTDFVDGIWNNAWGSTCFDDLMCATDAIEKRPGIDGKRIAAMGGSFGGYMCNFIGGQTTRFKALVTHASIFHLEAMCGASDYGPYFAIEMGTTSWKDRAAFEKHSPHRFVSKWKTPTLVLHGEKDYRVPISEALILFDALQEHGVESELVVFPDENHWVLKPRNIEAWYGHVLRFLDKHL